MTAKPIKTEADHTAALARMDQLLDAEPSSIECEEVELLAALIEMYEKRHHPMLPPDPTSDDTWNGPPSLSERLSGNGRE